MFSAFFIFISLALLSPLAGAQPQSQRPPIVAVAASFKPALTKLLAAYSDGARWQIVSGSSGKIASQLMAGANFALFLSADELRPQLIQKHRQLPADRLFRYGGGRLAFYGAGRQKKAPAPWFKLLKTCPALAVANPRHAPYGVAAHKLLAGLKLKARIITGQNVAQVAQFLRTGAVPCGLLALSYRSAFPSGTVVAIPDRPPLWQGGIVLGDQHSLQAALALRRFLLSPKAQALLNEEGFVSPAPGARSAKGALPFPAENARKAGHGQGA